MINIVCVYVCVIYTHIYYINYFLFLGLHVCELRTLGLSLRCFHFFRVCANRYKIMYLNTLLMISLTMKSNVFSMSISKSSIPYYYNGLRKTLFKHELFRRGLRWMRGELVSAQSSKRREYLISNMKANEFDWLS